MTASQEEVDVAIVVLRRTANQMKGKARDKIQLNRPFLKWATACEKVADELEAANLER